MFPYFPAKRLQKLRGMSKSTEAPTLKFNILPDQQKHLHILLPLPLYQERSKTENKEGRKK